MPRDRSISCCLLTTHTHTHTHTHTQTRTHTHTHTLTHTHTHTQVLQMRRDMDMLSHHLQEARSTASSKEADARAANQDAQVHNSFHV